MNGGKRFSVNTYCLWFHSLQSIRIIDCLRVLSVWSSRRRCWGRDTRRRWGPRRRRERSRRRRNTARLWHGTMQKTSACAKSGAVDTSALFCHWPTWETHLPIDISQSWNFILKQCLIEYRPFLDYCCWNTIETPSDTWFSFELSKCLMCILLWTKASAKFM